MSITADSPLVWPLPPDWANGVREMLTWLTEVSTASATGVSQHRQLRLAPRRSLSFDVLAHGQARRLIDLLLDDALGKVWLMPIWPDVQVLTAAVPAGATTIACRTAGFDFVAGGQALLWTALNTWSVVTISKVGSFALDLSSGIDADYPVGTRLYPLRQALISSADAPEETMLTAALSQRTITANMAEPCDFNAMWEPTLDEPHLAEEYIVLAVFRSYGYRQEEDDANFVGKSGSLNYLLYDLLWVPRGFHIAFEPAPPPLGREDSTSKFFAVRWTSNVDYRDYGILSLELISSEIDTPAPVWPIYRDWPVLEWRPDEGESPKSTQARDILLLDNDSGILFPVDLVGIARRTRSFTYLLHGREEQARFRSILYMLRGRTIPAWVPSYVADLVVVHDIAAVDTQITVEWTGYALYGRQQPSCRDIRIEAAGAVYYRRITGAADAGSHEILTLDSALGAALPAASIRQVSFMRLSTLASDSIEIEHQTDADGIATCTLALTSVVEDATSLPASSGGGSDEEGPR